MHIYSALFVHKKVNIFLILYTTSPAFLFLSLSPSLLRHSPFLYNILNYT